MAEERKTYAVHTHPTSTFVQKFCHLFLQKNTKRLECCVALALLIALATRTEVVAENKDITMHDWDQLSVVDGPST